MNKKAPVLVGMALIGLMFAKPQLASAQGNPPPLDPLLDLSGTPIPGLTYSPYTVDFVAAGLTTDITFAFRNDPGFTTLDDVAVNDLTTPSGNLIANGSFASGLGPWTYDNVYGAAFGGVVGASNCGGVVGLNSNTGDSADWCDGAVGSYDAIDQIIATTVGDTYAITFNLASGDATGNYPASGNFQPLCTNGADSAGPTTSCNAVDTLVYALAGIPASGNAPEPASMALLGTGLAALGLFGRRRSAKARATRSRS